MFTPVSLHLIFLITLLIILGIVDTNYCIFFPSLIQDSCSKACASTYYHCLILLFMMGHKLSIGNQSGL